MQSRRVGTLTFGTLLITLGIIYLIGTVFNINIERKVLDFWPLILVALGVEVLVLNDRALKNDMPLRYDFISFILIMVMLVFSFCTFTAGKLLGEILDPGSPLFYKNYIH